MSALNSPERYILFMRHGKAENSSPDNNDFERRLTEQGKAQLFEFFPRLTAQLKSYVPDGLWQVCSSPRFRAVQTAEIMQQCLADQGQLAVLPEAVREKKDFGPTKPYILSELDGCEMNHLLTAVSSETAGAVCLVGHQPYLTLWTYELTRKEIGFAPGDAVLLSIDMRRPRRSKRIAEFRSNM